METIIIKKRTDEDFKKQLDLVIGDDRMSAERTLRHLLDKFEFEFEELLKASSMGTNDHHLTLYNGVLIFLSQRRTWTLVSPMSHTRTLLHRSA